jgi:hypothetical protein
MPHGLNPDAVGQGSELPIHTIGKSHKFGVRLVFLDDEILRPNGKRVGRRHRAIVPVASNSPCAIAQFPSDGRCTGER